MTDKNLNLLPPESDKKKVGQKVISIVSDILADKDDLGLPQKWTRFYELTRNEQWKKKSTDKVPLVSANLIYRHRLQTVNTLTDNNPTFNVNLKFGTAEQKEVVEQLHRATQYWWHETEQQTILAESESNGETYGVTIEKMIFDPDLEYGKGEVRTVLVDPFHFGVYPVKEMDSQRGEGNFHFYPIPVTQLRRQFPKHADKIKADATILADLGDERREIAGGPSSGREKTILTQIGNTFKTLLPLNSDGLDEDEMEAFVVEAWVKDYTMQKTTLAMTQDGQELKQGDPNFQAAIQQGAQIMEAEEPKYPGYIRKVTVCNMGDLVLDDSRNPSINPNIPTEKAVETYLYDKFPFTREVSIRDTSDPWGMCDLEQLETLQAEFNKTLSQIILVKDKSARVKIVNPKDTGVPNDHLTNYPGVLNPKNSMVAQGLRFLDAPKLDQDLQQVLEVIKGLFFLVAGSFELEGATGGGTDRLSYKAIAALIEEVARLMRGKIRNYNHLIRERGRMYISHVQNWYTEDRWFTYEEDGKTQQGSVRGDQVLIPTRLTVVNGSTLPTSKVQQREEAIALFDKGAFGTPGSPMASKHLLKSMEWEGWQDVIKDLEAGPVGEVMEKLGMVGVPDQIMEYMQQVASTDQKDIEKALEKGELPQFQEVLQQSQQEEGEEPPMPPEELKTRAEIEKIMAEVQEVQARIAERKSQAQENLSRAREFEANALLVQEKLVSERVDQQVKLAGVSFDQEQIKINKAKVVSGIRNDVDKNFIESMKNKPGYNEKGIKSNNKEG